MKRTKARVQKMAGLTFTDELAMMITQGIKKGIKTESRRPLGPKSGVPKLQAGDVLYGRVTLISSVKTVSQEPIYRFMCSEEVRAELSALHNWTPAIHAPQSDAPFMLDLIEVRDEPLQSITEEGAKAEGATPMFLAKWDSFVQGRPLLPSTYINGFQFLWNEIYGTTDMAWDKNPMVRVFKWKDVRLRDQLHGQVCKC